MVLCFHGGWSWMSGGYVGVSVFFTLSGFLITRLLLDEHAATGRIDLGRFWARRIHRLMPAALGCVVAVIVARQFGAFDTASGLRADVIGALAQVANWVQLGSSTSYAEQISGAGGPLDHFWSLAIEEQFYWIWPLAMIVIMRRSRPRRAIVVVALVAAGMAPLVAAVWGADAAYWATPARVGEILIGAALAAITVHRRRATRSFHLQSPIGIAAFAVIAWTAVRWPTSGGPAYSGWFPALAVASAALVWSLNGTGWWQALWSLSPLSELGRISYGVYVWHWPIFLWLRNGAHPTVGRFALQVTITLVAAVLSYRLLEHRVRIARPAIRRDAVLTVLAVAGLAVIAITVPLAADDPFANPESAAGQLSLGAGSGGVLPPAVGPLEPAGAPATTLAALPDRIEPAELAPRDLTAVALPAPPARPVRILVVGDSVTWSLGNGLVAWAYQHPEYAAVGQLVAVSCGFIRDGEIPAFAGLEFDAKCDEMLDQRLPEAVQTLQPDVVLVMSTRADVLDRAWLPGQPALPSTDPAAVRDRDTAYAAFVEHLLFMGVPAVVWMEPPTARSGELPDEAMMDEAVMSSLRTAVRAATERWAPAAAPLDLAGWYAASGIDDQAARPDGLHFQPDAALVVADRMLAAALITAALDVTTPAGSP